MATPGPRAGAILDGAYALRRLIGRGAAGEVWLADDLVLGRPCAVKIVPPEIMGDDADAWREALRREASAMAALHHPNVAEVYAFGHDQDLHYFIMEWVDGETVAEEIARRQAARQPFPVRRALRIVAETCRGLTAVHKVGIVHRDVKPANIMLARDGRVVLIDFGLVRMPDGAGPGGAPVGTPRYMAPELARPTEHLEPEDLRLADVYSLGAAAYEILTGGPPFPGRGAREVIERHLHEAPEPPSRRRPDLPPIVDRLLLRALDKRPVERYASAEDFRAATAAVASRLRPAARVQAAPRVLVVDDDADFRAFVCTVVRHLCPDASLYTARDGAEALDVARRVQPQLAVLDLHMPEMDGLELAAALQRAPETAAMRVVVVSGGVDPVARAAFEKLGIVDVLDKPLRARQLLEAVQRAMAA